VSSALLRARLLASPREALPDARSFERFVQIAFHQRRRTLENNLEHSYPRLKEYFRSLGIEGARRAETLSVSEFANLWRALTAGVPEARE
jgi:16S rRNA (adenine1518-N6/adenine1519-N6)-dimethyltransferase